MQIINKYKICIENIKIHFIVYNMKYFDAHCHDYKISPNVIGAIVNATYEENWETVIASQSKNVIGAIGIHPWHVKNVCDGWGVRLRNTLLDNPDLMVGEIGLDNSRGDMELQESVFIAQLKIANELKRVANIHCVHAWDKMLGIIKTVPDIPAFVFHAFSGNSDIIKQLPSNSYFSYGMEIVRNNTTKSRERIIATPNNRLLVETDDATPDNLHLIVALIAEIKKLSSEQIADIIMENSYRVISHG